MLHFDTDYMEGAHPKVMRRLMKRIWNRLSDMVMMNIHVMRASWCAKHADSLKRLYIFW